MNQNHINGPKNKTFIFFILNIIYNHTCGVCTGFSHILHSCDPEGIIPAVPVAKHTQIYSILFINTVQTLKESPVTSEVEQYYPSAYVTFN